MLYFVSQNSIVRRIWGRSDTVMLIFAGAAAEFSLNKAVDWLYFTGRLPSDPLGRLFSTVSYAQRIIFSSNEKALRAIDAMNAIHGNLEKERAMRIPDWAYRDVLFMLIDYSRAAFETLERKMTPEEKEDLVGVFLRVGKRMRISGLPSNYTDWALSRHVHLRQDLVNSRFTEDLFNQYRKHLGWWRYQLLIAAQKLVLPDHAKQLLRREGFSWLSPVVIVYKRIRGLNVDGLLTRAALPAKYRQQGEAMLLHAANSRD